MSLLYSLVVDLVAREDALLPQTQGHHAHAILLAMIRQIDPDLSARLHGPGLKPFTASPLLAGPARTAAGWPLRAGSRYGLRFTALAEELFAKFLAALVSGEPREVRLGAAHFQIVAVHTQPAASPWAAVAGFDQLLEDASPGREIALEFCSPTAFQMTGSRSLLFPEPDLVFHSLAARWNAFAPAKIGRDLVDRLAASALVSRYRLETRIFDFGRYRKLGFVGQCRYDLRDVGDADARAANALAAFGFFAGVGYKTTMGMGQARRIAYGSK